MFLYCFIRLEAAVILKVPVKNKIIFLLTPTVKVRILQKGRNKERFKFKVVVLHQNCLINNENHVVQTNQCIFGSRQIN